MSGAGFYHAFIVNNLIVLGVSICLAVVHIFIILGLFLLKNQIVADYEKYKEINYI